MILKIYNNNLYNFEYTVLIVEEREGVTKKWMNVRMNKWINEK